MTLTTRPAPLPSVRDTQAVIELSASIFRRDVLAFYPQCRLDAETRTPLPTSFKSGSAFRLVDDHFDVLRKAIDENQGTVVKTMGDAVMAAFKDPFACVRGAIRCLRDFEEFRKTHEHGADTGLKLGLFTGACYVVTANESIDYFGQTVNCASRVQHLAESGEIVLEEELYERLPDDVRADLALVEKVETRVKGVDQPLRLVRTKLSARGSERKT